MANDIERINKMVDPDSVIDPLRQNEIIQVADNGQTATAVRQAIRESVEACVLSFMSASRPYDDFFKKLLGEAKRDKPKIITLCGSSRFTHIMAVCAWVLERDEFKIAQSLHLLPGWYPDVPGHHLAEHEGCEVSMDALHLHKIDISDEILVVNYEGYIGSSTSNEIAHATRKGIPIRFFTDAEDPVGVAVSKMISDAKKREDQANG